MLNIVRSWFHCDNSEVARLKSELKRVTAQRDDALDSLVEARELLNEYAKSYQNWDNSVTDIIGRHPNTGVHLEPVLKYLGKSTANGRMPTIGDLLCVKEGSTRSIKDTK
jgi:hypothetical protein